MATDVTQRPQRLGGDGARTGQLRTQLRKLALNVLSGLLAVAVLLGLWQLVTVGAHLSEAIVPAPSSVLRSLREHGPLLLHSTWPTLAGATYGYLIAILIALPLGWLMARPGPLKTAITTGVVAAQVFPKIALAPVFIVWFGVGDLTKVLFVLLLCFFPITINAAAGFASVPTELEELARVVGLDPIRRFWRIELPSSLPGIFAGLKTASGLAVIGAIVSEFVGSAGGLGFVVLQASSVLNTSMMFAALLIVAFIGFVFYGIVGAVEALAIPWHVSRRGLTK